MRWANWALLCGACCGLMAAAALVGGCGHKEGGSAPAGGGKNAAGSGPVPVRQGTAKEAVETYFLARGQADGEAIGQIVAPDYQQSARAIAASLAALLAKQKELADAVQAKFDKATADKLRAAAKNALAEQREFLDNGRVPWAKLKLDEKPNTATVTVLGKEAPLNLVRLDGKWYVVPPEAGSPAEFANQAARTKADVERRLAAADKLIARIKAGQTSREQVEAEVGAR